MKRMNISIIDYGMGNIQSVKNAFEFLNCHVNITDDPTHLKNSEGLVLPGVGAFGQAMFNLKDKKIINSLKSAVLEHNIPILGICLGMQLLSDKSSEMGNHLGLSLIPGETCKIPDLEGFRLPHIGWNNIQISKRTPLFSNIAESSSFYFVHSYSFMSDPKYISGTVTYGNLITAAVQNHHIFGVQFHPEKSQKKGLMLLNSFINYIENRNSKT